MGNTGVNYDNKVCVIELKQISFFYQQIEKYQRNKVFMGKNKMHSPLMTSGVS